MLSDLRHHEIIDAKSHSLGAHIIGAGAVGSRLYASLLELGFEDIHVYDDDDVEEHNLANQLFNRDDVGAPKVLGLHRWATRKIGREPTTHYFHPRRVLPTHMEEMYGTVFLLVDDLDTRRSLAEALRPSLDVTHIIDCRMNATNCEVYNIVPQTRLDPYLATIGDNANAEVSACGSPFSVAPTAALTANLAVWQFINNLTRPAGADEKVLAFFSPLTVSGSKL